MGENITTRGLDLLALPSGTRLHLGQSAVVELTGLRTPCSQLDNFQHGLMSACLSKDADGKVIRKSGVMSIVVAGGHVSPGDAIRVELPQEPRSPLEPV
jgi:MOSC domain-containing protein YiiM